MRSWLGNVGTALLSLVLAATVWAVAVQQENPRDVFSQPITVRQAGLAQNLTLYGESVSQAYVQVRAPRQRWADLQPSDFDAWIDLAGLAAGDHDVRVHVTPSSSDIQLVAVDPAVIHVRLDERREKLVPVRVSVLDAAAFGFDWLSPVVTPTLVLVSGSAQAVDQVNLASVDVFLRGTRTSVARNLPATARDSSGAQVAFVTLVPGEVQILVPVAQLPGYRDVAVRVDTSGYPASGYSVLGVSADPNLVTLFGDPAVISELSGYLSIPIDIAGVTADVAERVPLRLPENVSSLGTQSISVQVTVRPMTGAQTVQRRPVIQGLGPGLTYTLGIDLVAVFLSGPVPKLEGLKPDSVVVVLDLTGLGPGMHVIEPKVVAPDGIAVQGVTPQSFELALVLQAAPSPIPPIESSDGLGTSRSSAVRGTPAATATTRPP